MVWQKRKKTNQTKKVSILIRAVVLLLYKSFLPALPVEAVNNGKRRLLGEGFSPKCKSWITGDKVGLVTAFISMSTCNYCFLQHELGNGNLHIKMDVCRGKQEIICTS